jgi:hypothetical protein
MDILDKNEGWLGALRKVRKQVGRIKCRVVDQWPYAVLAAQVPAMRHELRTFVDHLPILAPSDRVRYEIHMLCGRRDIDMGILASWSLMRFMGGEAKLIVHSDGSLDGTDSHRWKRVVGHLELISRTASDATVSDALSHTRHLYPWRMSNWASAQLVDAHFFGSNDRFLIMDSDVLVFENPWPVIAAFEETRPRFGWCEDLRNCYSGEIDVIEQITGLRVPERLCAGFLISPRMSVPKLEGLDQQIERIHGDGRIDTGHYWSCQTYFSLLAAGYEGSKQFPSAYRNTMGSTRHWQPMRHYVGIPSIRYRYFTEGVQILRQQIAKVGKVDRA